MQHRDRAHTGQGRCNKDLIIRYLAEWEAVGISLVQILGSWGQGKDPCPKWADGRHLAPAALPFNPKPVSNNSLSSVSSV